MALAMVLAVAWNVKSALDQDRQFELYDGPLAPQKFRQAEKGVAEELAKFVRDGIIGKN